MSEQPTADIALDGHHLIPFPIPVGLRYIAIANRHRFVPTAKLHRLQITLKLTRIEAT
ncbi:hypothetical protein [Haloferula sp.]|uniref:hypothetical protein n=1 Tax=Haloferula sp. TaxID=2497595 RepID=UPI003C718C15